MRSEHESKGAKEDQRKAQTNASASAGIGSTSAGAQFVSMTGPPGKVAINRNDAAI